MLKPVTLNEKITYKISTHYRQVFATHSNTNIFCYQELIKSEHKTDIHVMYVICNGTYIRMYNGRTFKIFHICFMLEKHVFFSISLVDL